MFKFTIDESQIRATEAAVQKSFERIIEDQNMLKEIGIASAERIRFQARVGKPINDQGKFKPLAPSTVSKRRYLAKENQVQATFSPTLSNITLTGALLDNLGFDVTGSGELTLVFKGNHPRYQGKKGLIGKEITNAQLADYLTEKGFAPFTPAALSAYKPFLSRITSIVRAYLRRSLKSG